MIADLRSDTFTRPTPEMLQFMMQAPIGDDVYGEDPSVAELERKMADMFGMDDAIFCPSGTMTNQIGIKLLTQPMEEIICDKNSHIQIYEGGGIAYNSLISSKLIDGDRGMITAEQVEAAINPDDLHQPISKIVALENTMNKGGGAIYDMEEIRKIAAVCEKHSLHLHLDGARLFNALVVTNDSPKEYGRLFKTISVCLSKGLGAPIGSVLLFNGIPRIKAVRLRKVMGGGMRQAGLIASAGTYALDHHVERLKDDHRRAKQLANALKEAAFVEDMYPVETNIVIFKVKNSAEMVKTLAEKGVKCITFSPVHVRMVTHLDFTDDMLEHTLQAIHSI
ncbi:MAG: threonine aldolase [Thalassobius sp.]|nr:threonine aldolase [Thalassovita sp.]